MIQYRREQATLILHVIMSTVVEFHPENEPNCTRSLVRSPNPQLSVVMLQQTVTAPSPHIVFKSSVIHNRSVRAVLCVPIACGCSDSWKEQL
jgi:hypothetical protein